MKRALVTGGARRIGAALVRRLAEMGYAVTVHCRNSRQEAEELIATLPHASIHGISVCDLADPAAVRAWLTGLPDFEVVINNASLYRLTPRGGTESAQARRDYRQVNVNVPLELIRRMHSGCAVNLLDADALAPDGGIRPASELPEGIDSYLETRKTLARKTLELARKMAPEVRVNAIAPGAVLPPADCAGPGFQKILAKVPLARPVRVEEIADAMELLIQSPSLTGVILPADGGKHLGENPENFAD